jgi:hypothetical protein
MVCPLPIGLALRGFVLAIHAQGVPVAVLISLHAYPAFSIRVLHLGGNQFTGAVSVLSGYFLGLDGAILAEAHG